MSTVSNDTTTAGGHNKRWNFNAFLSGFLIPRCVALRRELAPGARLLWAVIRAFSRRDGYCDASEKTLASRIGVSSRQIRRYLKQLEIDGWVETELRTGSTARRYLLLHPLFGGALAQPPDISVQGVGRKRPGGRTDVSTTVLDLSTDVRSGLGATSNLSTDQRKRVNGMRTAGELLEQMAKGLDRTPSGNGKHPRPTLRRLGDLTQDSAIRREVECWKIPCTEQLLATLMKKADFYGVNGFQVAAAIANANRKIATKPSAQPQTRGWFVTVVEEYFAQHFKPPAHRSAPANQPPKGTRR